MTRLETVASSMSMHAWFGSMEASEHNRRAAMDAETLSNYRRHLGEIGDCPNCGADGVELKYDEHPDMVGTTYSTTFSCCGHVVSTNSACEYDAHGHIVDVG
jgi:hypothetical protein